MSRKVTLWNRFLLSGSARVSTREANTIDFQVRYSTRDVIEVGGGFSCISAMFEPEMVVVEPIEIGPHHDVWSIFIAIPLPLWVIDPQVSFLYLRTCCRILKLTLLWRVPKKKISCLRLDYPPYRVSGISILVPPWSASKLISLSSRAIPIYHIEMLKL